MSIENFNKNQDFTKIRRTYSNTNRFTDEQFPPCNESIGITSDLIKKILKSRGLKEIKWKRAKVKSFKLLTIIC